MGGKELLWLNGHRDMLCHHPGPIIMVRGPRNLLRKIGSLGEGLMSRQLPVQVQERLFWGVQIYRTVVAVAMLHMKKLRSSVEEFKVVHRSTFSLTCLDGRQMRSEAKNKYIYQ